MKKFLCYDTNDVANGKIDVDNRGVLKSAGSSTQADWNVTDSADPAFIKNKPFGDVAGVTVFSEYVPSSTGTDDSGNSTFTFTSDNVVEMTTPILVDILLQIEGNGAKTYSNIPGGVHWDNSEHWTATFDTTGLPFTAVLYSGYSGGTTVVVTSLDGSYINGINIKDMERSSVVKINKKYIPDAAQSDWNETDSSDPAFILNKPEIPNGVTWFSASGTQNNMVIKKGENWNNGTAVNGTELMNVFKKGICRCNVTLTECSSTCESIGTIVSCREFVVCGSNRVGAVIACYIDSTGGGNANPVTVEASVQKL